jgi:diguanylate cyclase (GGDEF)-like protein
VLIVDDSPDVRDLVRVVLRTAGCTIVGEASRGDEAVTRAADASIDTIVLDWEMPGGTGLDVLPELRRVAAGARIILYSSRDAADARPRALAAGADFYLEKSETTSLVAAVRALAGAPVPAGVFRASAGELIEQWGARCERMSLDPDREFGAAVLAAVTATESVPPAADDLTAMFRPGERLEDLVRMIALLRSTLADRTDRVAPEAVQRDVSARLDRAFDELLLVAVEREAARLRADATTDPLTGLGNRRAFTEAIQREIDRAARYGHALSVVVIDLDGLKTLNDRDGYQAGDEALLRLASSLRQATRAVDTAFRVGGDEFVLLLAETTPEQVPQIVDRLPAFGAPAHTSGTAAYPVDADDRDALLSIADQRLRQARQRRAPPSR